MANVPPELARQRQRDAALQRRRSRLEDDHVYDADVWVNLLYDLVRFSDGDDAERRSEEMVAVALGCAHGRELGVEHVALVCDDGRATIRTTALPPWLACRAFMAALWCRDGLAFQTLVDRWAVLAAPPQAMAENVDIDLVAAIVAAAFGEPLAEHVARLQQTMQREPHQAQRFFFHEHEVDPSHAASDLRAFVANLEGGDRPIANRALQRVLDEVRRYRGKHPTRRPVGLPRAEVAISRSLSSSAELAGFMVLHRLLEPTDGPARDGDRRRFVSPDGLATVTLSTNEGHNLPALDAGELMAVSERWARSVGDPPPTDPSQRKTMGGLLALSLAAIDAIVARCDPTTGAVPAAAFVSSVGRQAYQRESGRFEKERLLAVRNAYADLLDAYEGGPALDPWQIVPHPAKLTAVDEARSEIHSSVLLFGVGVSELVGAMVGAGSRRAGDLIYGQLGVPIRGWNLCIHLYGLDDGELQQQAAKGLAPFVDALLLVQSRPLEVTRLRAVADEARRNAVVAAVGIEGTHAPLEASGLSLDFTVGYALSSPREALKPLMRLLLARLPR